MKLAGLLSASLIFLPSLSSADYDRRNWIIEQIAQPPLPPLIEEMKNQAGVGVASYGDAISTETSLLVNARIVEVGAKISQRFFGSFSQEGKSYRALADNSKTNYAFEIARSYVTRHHHYGRVGIEYVQFQPEAWPLLRLGFNTGILESEEIPMFLRINISLFKRIKAQYGESDMFFAGGEIGKRFELGKISQWKLGGFLNWTYRTNNRGEDLSNVGRYEHMLFSLGPFAEYVTGALHLRLSIPWRLWLDRQVAPAINPRDVSAAPIYVSEYPNKMSLPDVSLTVKLIL